MLKRYMKYIITLCLMLAFSTSHVFAAQTVEVDQVYDTNSTVYLLASKAYYWYSQGNTAKMNESLDALKAEDQDAYQFAKDLIDYWTEVDEADFVNEALGVEVEYPGSGNGTTTYDNQTGIPTNLPTSQHAFVVLGYALAAPSLTDEQKEDSFKLDEQNNFTWQYMELFMQDELKGRCDVAIRAAKMYPNSLIFCTGGGTSKVDPQVSEGLVMKTYMVNVGGIDADRIIVEDSASNTVQNGLNSMPEILDAGVTKMTIITSDYHIRRGCMIFKGVSMRFAKAKGSQEVALVSNIGFKTTKKTEGISSEYGGAGLGGVVNYMSSDTPTALTLSGKTTYAYGEALDLKASAEYALSGEKDVTSSTEFTGYEAKTPGTQTVTGTFSYKTGFGPFAKTVTITATIDVTVGENTTPVDTITLDKSTLTLTVGESDTLQAAITPDDVADPTITWSSDKASVAKVSADGEVTAVKAGTATITATASNGLTATCKVTVKAGSGLKDDYITSATGEVSGSEYLKLMLKGKTATKNSITLKWNKRAKAAGYLVYANTADDTTTYKFIKNITKKSTTTLKVTELADGSALEAGTYYKFVVVAYKKSGGKKKALTTSKPVYITTTGGEHGNYKSVKSPKSSYKIKKDKTLTLDLTTTFDQEPVVYRDLSYASTVVRCAQVSSDGVITAKKKGTCTIYVYTQNGISKKIKIKVVK